MDFRVLGAVEIVGPDGPRPVGGPKQRMLLAALLAGRRSVVPISALTDVLWGDDPPSTARSTLQTAVSKLRSQVNASPDAELVSRPPGYLLDVADTAVDADRFESYLALARARAADRPTEAVELLDQALACWRGPAFAEFAALPWALGEATRLEELRLQAVEERGEIRLALGDHDSVIGELEGLVRAEPLRERMWGQLVIALHRSGRQAEALRAASAFRTHLREELGLDPSEAFVRLEQAVVAGEPGPQAPPPDGRAGAARPSSPAPVHLVGRVEAIEDVEEAIRSARVVTLTGSGGVGKSSMAIEVARRLAPGFSDGVRVAELAPLPDEGAVLAAVAHSVDAERRSGRSLLESIAEVLGSQELLLVLDNCEHVIDAVGDVVRHLVRWCPGVTVLATSREPIGMPGEVVRPVPPLAVPTDPGASLAEIAAAPAVEVFVARAAESAPGFELTEESAAAVAELCIHLDGLPLAIELAAARMSSMTPAQLAERLGERFVLLRSGSGRSQRHRNLLDVVQWSFALLDPVERTLLARLSVFAGGFDLDAVEQTCALGDLDRVSIAPVLSDLVDKSLVVAERTAGRVRYSQLETLRQFGAERLAEQADGPAVHLAHVATFADRALVGGAALDGPDEADWAGRLDGDFDNLRTAFGTATEVGDAHAALTLVCSLSELAFRRIRYELVHWARAAIAMEEATAHPLRPTALGVLAYGAFVRGELEDAVTVALEAVELRERLGVPSCGLPERALGNALFYQGKRDAAVGWIQRMVEVAEENGQVARLAHGLYMRSVAQTSVGDPDGGAAFAVAATAAADRCGSPTASSQAAYASGLVAAAVSRSDDALDLLERSAELADSVGNRWMRAFALTEAMWLRAKRGEVEEALAGYREIVETWFRGGDWANQWLSLRHLAGILASIHRDGEAALLFGAVQAAGAAAALPLAPPDAEELTELADTLGQRLGAVALARATERGATMRDDATVAMALTAIDGPVPTG